LHALSSVFHHDQDGKMKSFFYSFLSMGIIDSDCNSGFWQAPGHYDSMAASLITQLTQSASTSLESEVIQTIVELAVAGASPEHHKELNSALLKLMRSTKANARLAAVRCEHSLTERLGEEWLTLLPELLPVVSELQEDEDEEVENETLKWIKMIEDILGENLDTMLR
jgi:U3 small nucleolar RNA-associated protein 10